MKTHMKRNRIIYALLFLLTIGLGIASRKINYLFPDYINLVLGDAIWAMMIYFGVCFCFNKFTVFQVALLAIFFCYAIEISQLYHAPWIDYIRNTTIGGLVLGFGFLWSDILAYSIGVFVAALLEYLTIKSAK
ncbi:MAG: DUF2809 domain-containing protein [Bacteroidia bacterium]